MDPTLLTPPPMAPALPPRMARMAEDIAEAMSVAAPEPPQPGGMAPPAGAPAPQPGGMAPPAGGEAPTALQAAAPGLGPNQSPSPLQATTSFKTPPVESFLQKEAGRKQMPTTLGDPKLVGG